MGYYMGDYYRGDPGFFSFLGKAAQTIGGFIPGVGGIVQKAGALISKAAAKPGIKQVVGAVAAHPVLSAAGAAATAGVGAGALGTKMASHPAAAGMKAVGVHAMRGMGGGKRRRMRVTNPKALRRAIRRTAGFARLAMKTIHLIHPRKKVRFGGFRHKKKR
jgi:adenylosuccinate synthase